MYRALIIPIIAAVVAGIAANSKGRNILVWSLLCFFLPLLVVVILLLPPKVVTGKTKRCPHCSQVIGVNEGFCPYCKNDVPINLVQCRECGSFVPESDYCMQCNKKL